MFDLSEMKLNLSMIRRFFEKEMDYDGNPLDNGYLFKDLKISARSCASYAFKKSGCKIRCLIIE